jgi:uncharacterized OB-fold protein
MLSNMPAPTPDYDTQEFWDRCAQGVLALPTCPACQHVRWPPGPNCPKCLCRETDWKPSSGRGTVYAWTVVANPPGPGLTDDLPYIVAMVDLPEGARIVANIVDCGPSDVRAGMPLEVIFERRSDGVTIYNFTPADH